MTRDELLDAMSEAFWGAYDAAPPGEGVVGAAEFGCLAAILVALDGLSPLLAMARAIGETGHYGRPRKHELVPRQGPGSVAGAAADARRLAIEECARIADRRWGVGDEIRALLKEPRK